VRTDTHTHTSTKYITHARVHDNSITVVKSEK